MEQGLEEIFASIGLCPQPMLANIGKTSTCHTPRRKEMAIMSMLGEGRHGEGEAITTSA